MQGAGPGAQNCWQLLQFLAFAAELRMDSYAMHVASRRGMAEYEPLNRKLPYQEHLRVDGVVVH